MSETIRFLYEGGKGEIEVKKSRFLAELAPVTTEEEANAFIAAKKKEFWDARHNCHAFIVGEKPEILRFSDDGEPGGTAGKPMLEILQHEGLHDVVAVVTRYFGGVLLGTGGLVRAYQGAVQEALPACRFGQRFTGQEIDILLPYTLLGKIQHFLRERPGVFELETIYEQDVTVKLVTPVSEKDALCRGIKDLLGGQAGLTIKDPDSYDEVDGKII